MSTENLAILLDALTETSVYVIEEESRRLLYFNRRCRDTGRGKAVLGAKCHEVWPEVCANCPLSALEGKQSVRMLCFDPLLGTTVDVTANRILWDGHIPAVVVTATPHHMNFEEEQGRRKIERMYAQSLVTVFDECVVVNLTADYYVNCQKDAVWTDIPEQGNFGVENLNYARKTVHPADFEAFTEHFSREALLRGFGAGKQQISKRLRRLSADGGYRMVEFTAARIGAQEEDCWCVLVFRDVQEEYLLEQRRSIEIGQLATAAGIAYQMLIAVNLTQNTYHMLEYERYPVPKPGDAGRFDDLIAGELATVHPDYRAEFIGKFSRRALTEAYTGGARIVTMEVPHLGEDGQYHWNFTQVVRVETPDTDDLIEITLSRNIDGERRLREEALEKERRAKQLLEEALEKAEQSSRAKNEFLSRMSHDIRTPMNAIMGMTELAQQHLGEEEKLRDYLAKVERSGAHLLGLMNEVLDVSRIESGAFRLEETEIDLRDVMQEAVELVRVAVEGRGQTLEVTVDGAVHTRVLGDGLRLRQVLVNLLENASKYTGEGGRISLLLEELDREAPVGSYRFTVEDNGVGMTPEYLEYIFEPFSRADDSRISKVAGTGLGMTIVHNLVSMMDGEIQVESEYGKGSRFRIAVCLAKRDAPAVFPPCAPRAGGEVFPGVRVLLVEDNELNRQIATEMLGLLEADVEVAEDGRQAVEAVRGHPPFYYDAVFMDIQMPVMDGYEAAAAIRALPMEGIGELPILAMTADVFVEDAKRARLAGMDGHLNKPISVERLRGALAQCQAWRRRNGRGGGPG